MRHHSHTGSIQVEIIIVKRFIEKANQQTRREIEQLIEGKAIQKEIRLELTYNELDSTIENLWSVLFATATSPNRENHKEEPTL